MAEELLIAVVEDDLSLQAALVRLVRSLGYRACGFSSAEEFLDSDGMSACACVITDIQMPGRSGIEVAASMTALRPGVPVIVITARDGADIEKRVIDSGALCLIRKPIDTGRLIECLEQALLP